MGNLSRGVKDKVEVDTQSVADSPGSYAGTRKVKKESRVKVKSSPPPAPRNVVIGFKILQGQVITEFTMDGTVLTSDAPAGPVTTGFNTGLASSTGANETWVGFDVQQGQLPRNLNNFVTTLEIDNFPGTQPYVQAVPIVIAESIAELNAGNYIAAASFVARE